MYPQLATAVARRGMLLADLNTAEEGDGGAGLHAEALVAAGGKSQAHTAFPDLLPTDRRVIQNVTDVDQIHLPSQTFVGGVNAHPPSIAAEARVQIDPVFSLKIGH